MGAFIEIKNKNNSKYYYRVRGGRIWAVLVCHDIYIQRPSQHDYPLATMVAAETLASERNPMALRWFWKAEVGVQTVDT